MKINLKTISPNKLILGLVMMLMLNYGAAQAQPQQGLMSRLNKIQYRIVFNHSNKKRNQSS